MDMDLMEQKKKSINYHALSVEIWAAAQLLPNEGIEDAVARIEGILKSAINSQHGIKGEQCKK